MRFGYGHHREHIRKLYGNVFVLLSEIVVYLSDFSSEQKRKPHVYGDNEKKEKRNKPVFINRNAYGNDRVYKALDKRKRHEPEKVIHFYGVF